MAGYNEILVGRFARGLQKLTGIKGSPPATTLASDIIPILPIAEAGAETRYLLGWNRFAKRVRNPAAAGTGSVRMRNPANSNVIVVIESLSVTNSGPDNMLLTHDSGVAADLATNPGIDRGDAMDTRGQAGYTVVLSNATGAGLLNARSREFGVTNGVDIQLIQHEEQELVLTPGDAYQVSQQTSNNVVLAVSFIWRERFLEESERT